MPGRERPRRTRGSSRTQRRGAAPPNCCAVRAVGRFLATAPPRRPSVELCHFRRRRQGYRRDQRASQLRATRQVTARFRWREDRRCGRSARGSRPTRCPRTTATLPRSVAAAAARQAAQGSRPVCREPPPAAQASRCPRRRSTSRVASRAATRGRHRVLSRAHTARGAQLVRCRLPAPVLAAARERVRMAIACEPREAASASAAREERVREVVLCAPETLHQQEIGMGTREQFLDPRYKCTD